ncbi:MAG: hypothetical protein HOP29_09015, partial [Phycisphaerales bacterium]|nr:hypothetical protein [Phycisphaerales bacterium]
VTANGIIYVGEQTGIFHILKDEGERCVSLHRQEFKRDDDAVDEIYGSPAVASGRVYFMTRYGTYCLGDPSKMVESGEMPAAAEETGGSGEGGERHCHIEPAEVTTAPGESVTFHALVTGPTGMKFRSLREPTWSSAGVKGTINEHGVLEVGKDNAFSAGQVKVSGEGIEGSARIRVVPKLPISEDFEAIEAGGVPPGWLGVGAKTRIEERDGSKVLRKLAPKERPTPPVMRLMAFATPVIEGGYVVQADMMSLPKKRFKSDMGLMNSRYTMLLTGQNELQVESWASIPRFRHAIPMEWKTETWYRAKVEGKLEGDKARVRAKAWPRDSEEPAEWMVDVVDPCPNREGAAGLYAYSTNTTPKSDGPESFFDNFRVWKEE